MLLEVFTQKWQSGTSVKFLITPGGFVTATWPSNWSGDVSWQSRPCDVVPLIAAAEHTLKRVLTSRVLAAATRKVEVLTIGIDVGSLAELVAIIDVRAGQVVQWTGKSYPTSRQERTLIQVANLDSHLLSVAGERVLVLGCHDLNMFSHRSRANQGPMGMRRERCDAMKSKVHAFQPSVVLQHPHSTDTPNTWRHAWSSLVSDFPSVKAWASAISYCNGGKLQRVPLPQVLEFTKGGDASVDIEIDS